MGEQKSVEVERGTWLPVAALVGLVAVTWASGLDGAFVFDDIPGIVLRADLDKPLSLITGLKPRFTANLSFSLDRQLHGLNATAFRTENVLIHAMAAVVLFAILHSTFRRPRFGEAIRGSARLLAFVAAATWAVHPLQTQSVTYVVQRMESLMGLFVLLSLYSLIRSASDDAGPSRRRWQTSTVVFLLLAVGTKEVAIVAPVVLLLYDRVFLAESWQEILRRRMWLHLAISTPLILAGTIIALWSDAYVSSGVFIVEGISPLDYALTQPGVILHYLRLSVVPIGLCLDYDWPVATLSEAILPGLALIGLLVGVAYCWKSNPPLAFAAAWFFLILAPTSSVVPLRDPAFEHRMYLPLAAVTSILAVLVFQGLRNVEEPKASVFRRGLAVGIIGALATLTIIRNEDYSSQERIYLATIREAPHNVRVLGNLGELYTEAGHLDRAEEFLTEALRHDETDSNALINLAIVYRLQGRPDESMQVTQQALEQEPNARAFVNAADLIAAADPRKAVSLYQQALELRKNFAPAHFGLAVCMDRLDNWESAELHFQKAIQLKSTAHVRSEYGSAMASRGHLREARKQFEQSLKEHPPTADIHNNLGVIIMMSNGSPVEAARHFQRAIALNSEHQDARRNLARLQSVLRQ